MIFYVTYINYLRYEKVEITRQRQKYRGTFFPHTVYIGSHSWFLLVCSMCAVECLCVYLSCHQCCKVGVSSLLTSKEMVDYCWRLSVFSSLFPFWSNCVLY